ncbi:ABC-type glycerol-3-phosphate transport system substrate-binding protein [Lachnotalea glycerini]|uniref:ABC-type glycerol-3-phosphate transport system substrate-binding protein n=1 Tax=Lachnotalea glycerini TaxID=1763509 RepID=A0A318EPI6_9FIRM|nr:ABC transporter substrate-binding protein [Lachnotalea glycerini]PXV93337.1 ABC-type glycerol-3-phosphate transport system substrate-binding protein [Lachnotalea glycerini]
MKKRKAMLCFGLVLTMMGSILGGCGTSSSSIDTSNADQSSSQSSEETGELDTFEEVELVMYVIGDRPAGQDAVDENFNQLIKEKLNCTLKLNWIPWSDYANKYPLLFSSGEEFDMAYTSGWLNFASLARKGAFMSLDELWATYAPKNFSKQSVAALQEATIDGHYYCIPTMLSTYNAYGPIYRTDIMEGSEWDGKMETFEDVETYCDIVKETKPEMEPLDIYSAGSEWDDTWMWSLGYSSSKGSSNDFLFFDSSQENPQLFTYYESDQTNEFLEMMARWNEKGFFSKSALSDTDSTKTQNGKAAVRTHNVDNYASYSTIHPEWSYSYSNLVKSIAHLPYTQDAMVISNTSKNPERALALWDLITNDQEVFDAFYYGILDKTYTLDDSGDYAITDADNYAVSTMWAARTTEFNRNIVGTPADYNTMKEGFETSIVAGEGTEKYSAFTIDTSSIETEYAACQSAHQQYWWPLELGYTDAATGLAEYQEKMEAAGIEKVRTEIQKQLDAYIANLK